MQPVAAPASLPPRTGSPPPARAGEARLQRQLLQEMSVRRQPPHALPPSHALHHAAAPAGARTANLLDILDSGAFKEVPLRRINARVAWFNRHLLQEIEPDVDWSDAVLTPGLENAIVERCGYVVDEDLLFNGRAGPPAAFGRADRYRVANDDTRGAGRAVFLPGGEYSKGAGRTGLGPTGHTHRDGRADLEEALVEAAAGEAFADIAGGMSTRVLAVLVPREDWRRDDAERSRSEGALIIRVGMPPRPAHFVSEAWGGKPRRYDEGAMERAMQRMFGDGPGAMRERIVGSHAVLAARMRRHGLLHGTLDESNMGLAGTALDFGTFTAQPRGAPLFTWSLPALVRHARHNIWLVDARIFGSEHRAVSEIVAKPLRLQREWAAAWREAKDVVTLAALGLPEETARQVLNEQPEAARPLAKHLRRIGRYFRGGQAWNAREKWDEATGAAVADPFRLFRELAETAFDTTDGSRRVLTEEGLFALLDFRPPPAGQAAVSTGWRARAAVSKYAVASADEARQRVNENLRHVVRHYANVIETAAEAGVRAGRWPDRGAFLRCITARAAFENRPLHRLFHPALHGPAASGRDPMRGADSPLELAIARSRRNVDRMLYRMPVAAAAAPGSWRLQMRKLGGALFYLEADLSGERRLCVEIPVHLLDEDARAAFLDEASADHGVLRLTREVAPYEYREVADDFDRDGVTPLPRAARGRYAFAVPDGHELAQITAAARGDSMQGAAPA